MGKVNANVKIEEKMKLELEKEAQACNMSYADFFRYILMLGLKEHKNNFY